MSKEGLKSSRDSLHFLSGSSSEMFPTSSDGAAIRSCVGESVSQNYTESGIKQKLGCNNCIEYQYKLEKLILELSSAKKIIQLLQEDHNTSNVPVVAGTPEEDFNTHVSNNLNNTWKTVTGKSRKSKKPNDTSLDQFPIPVTTITSRYQALHNLQNDTEFSVGASPLCTQ
jgi:hypothetical protein